MVKKLSKGQDGNLPPKIVIYMCAALPLCTYVHVCACVVHVLYMCVHVLCMCVHVLCMCCTCVVHVYM